MVRWAGLTGLLGAFVLVSCDGRLLPDGFPSSTDHGTGGAPSTIVLTRDDGAGGAPGTGGQSPAGAGGAAGSPGMGGSAGSGDQGSDGGAPTCDDLAALYIAGVEQDKACDPTSADPQCQLREIPALCAACPATTYVNSRAAATAARLRWDAVPCPVPTNCAPTCGPLPTGGRCVPTESGGGRCMDL